MYGDAMMSISCAREPEGLMVMGALSVSPVQVAQWDAQSTGAGVPLFG